MASNGVALVSKIKVAHNLLKRIISTFLKFNQNNFLTPLGGNFDELFFQTEYGNGGSRVSKRGYAWGH